MRGTPRVPFTVAYIEKNQPGCEAPENPPIIGNGPMDSHTADANAEHIFYVHSPITYSIALKLIESEKIADFKIIGGRSMQGKGIDCCVEDDGMWSEQRVCPLLEAIRNVSRSTSGTILYLPHTAFLFGKLVKICSRIDGIAYLEEGYTSTQEIAQNRFFHSPSVDIDQLIQALTERRLIENLGINRALLHDLNQLPVNAFDATMGKYRGCYAVSADAFTNMPAVRHLQLEAAPDRQPGRLLSVFGIRNLARPHEETDQLCRSLIRIVKTIADQTPVSTRFLVKLHPRDIDGLPEFLYNELAALQCDYNRFCAGRQLDHNKEPALHNFDHYYILGNTAQEKYIRQILGNARITRLDTPQSNFVAAQ